MFLSKKKERKIIILGTGPGCELCPFDRETWAIAKILMTTKPLWRVDKLFSLDDPNDMLSFKKGHTKEEYLEKQKAFDNKVRGFSEGTIASIDMYANPPSPDDKEGEKKLIYNQHNTAKLTEEIHYDLMELTRIREGLNFQNKFTREQFIGNINKTKRPFITQRRIPDIPLSEPFPLKQCIGIFGTPYFTNTICYMIALAIMEGVTDIQLWGVVQGGYQEYLRERKGVEYWLGQAAGKGVHIDIRGMTNLFTNDDQGKLYGYKKTYEQLLNEGLI